MTSYRTFKPPNPLASCLKKPGGLDSKVAIAAARVAVDRFADEAAVEIEQLMMNLARTVPFLRSGDTAKIDLVALYDHASTLVSLSGAFDRPGLSAAANSLCQLLAESILTKPNAIIVHIEALRLIHRHDAQGPILLDGLRRVALAA